MEKQVIEFQCEMCNFKTNHLGGLNRHKTLKHKKKSVNENAGNAINIEILERMKRKMILMMNMQMIQ